MKCKTCGGIEELYCTQCNRKCGSRTKDGGCCDAICKDCNRTGKQSEAEKNYKLSIDAEIEKSTRLTTHGWKLEERIKELEAEFQRVDSEKDDLLLELSKRESRIKELER